MENSCHRGDQIVPETRSDSLPKGGTGEIPQNSVDSAEKKEERQEKLK